MVGFLNGIFDKIFQYNDRMNAVGAEHLDIILAALEDKLGRDAFSVVQILLLAACLGVLVAIWLILNKVTESMIEKEPSKEFIPNSTLFLASWLIAVACIEISWLVRWTTPALEVAAAVILVWKLVRAVWGIFHGQLPRQLLGLVTAIVLILAFPYLWSLISLIIIVGIIASVVLGGIFNGGSQGTGATTGGVQGNAQGSVSWPGVMYQGLTEFQRYGDVGYGKQYKNMDTGEIVVVTNFVPTGLGEADTSIGHVTWPG